MQIGVSSYSFSAYMRDGKYSIYDVIDMAAEIGFEGIEFTDFGRIGELSFESRTRFVELLHAGVTRDAEAGAAVLLEMAGSASVDEVALEKDIADLIARYYERRLADINIAELLTKVLAISRTYHLRMPRDFAVMFATLIVLEGVGRDLDPNFNFTSAIAPFVQKMMKDRWRLSALSDRAEKDIRRTLGYLNVFQAILIVSYGGRREASLGLKWPCVIMRCL